MAVCINEFLVETSIPVVLQSPYSPDLSLRYFFLFTRLKNHLKGCHFGTLDNIQKSITDELKGIPTEAFQHCYKNTNKASVAMWLPKGTILNGITLICKENKIHG
jgi:hypothetical protein